MLQALMTPLSYLRGICSSRPTSQTEVPALIKGVVSYEQALTELRDKHYSGDDRAQKILSVQARKLREITGVLKRTYLAKDNARQVIEGFEAGLELAVLFPRDGEDVDSHLTRLSKILGGEEACPFPLEKILVTRERIREDRENPGPGSLQGVSSVVYKQKLKMDCGDVEVAVKCFSPLKGIYFPTTVTRYGFWRELSIQGKVNAQGTCRVASALTCFDFGDEDDISYLVMPAMDGSLEQLSYQFLQGAVPYKRLLDSMEPITSTLASVHREAILHRDIKPSNILYKGTQWYLCDFSLATTTDEVASFEGLREHFVGSYLPPQALNEIKLPLGLRLVLGRSPLKASAAIDAWALSLTFLMALGARTGFSERYTDDFIEAFLKGKDAGRFGILPSFKVDYDFSKIPSAKKSFLKKGLNFSDGYQDGMTMLTELQK